MHVEGKLYDVSDHARIEVRSGLIERVERYSVGQRPPASAGGSDQGRWIDPGFFDLQVNGFAGCDFCTPRVTVADVEAAARAMLATGVTRFLPTIITGGLDDTATGQQRAFDPF